METVRETIERELLSWPGVTASPHRFGGVEFSINRHEIGHLHGNRLADLPFPVRIRKELLASGRASLHHVHPESGWVSSYIRGIEDVPHVIELFRMNYDRLTRGRGAKEREEAGKEKG